MSGQGRLESQILRIRRSTRSFTAATFLVIAVLLCAAAHFPNQAIAQTINWPLPVDWQNDAELTDLFALDANNVWVVGQRGLVLHTIDGGKTWRQKSLVPEHQGRPTITCTLESVVFTSPANGWIAGGFHSPQSSTSKGILFRTIDGGRTWTELPANLPWIKQLFFPSPQEGFAIGQGNVLKPGGVFQTFDGGQSWASSSEGQMYSWQTGSLINGTLVLSPVGDSQASGIYRFRNNRLIKTRINSTLTNVSPRNIQMMDEQFGFAVGDQNQFLQTEDGGMSWSDSPMRTGLPQSHIDFRTMSIQGDRMWVAGNAGRRLYTLHAKDKTWQAVDIPVQMPINKLTFVDDTNGWAISASGSIIHTSDGGATWRKQRKGSKGIALLQIAQEPGQMVPELFGRYCADQPYVGSGLIVSNETQIDPMAVSLDQATAAMMRVNASFLHRYQVTAGTAGSTDRNEQLNEYLVRQIRSLQPRVIALASGRFKRDQLSLRTAVLSAVNDAADYQKYTEFKQLGLDPWQVGKVVIVDRGDLGSVKISSNHYIPGVSALLTDYAMPSRMLLQQKPIENRQVSLTKIYNSPFAAGPDTTLFGSIENYDADVPRRSRKRTSVGNLVQMRQLAAKTKTLDRILNQAKQGVTTQAWSTGLAELTSQLDEASSGVWLFHLARRCETNGQLELAAETHEYLANRFRKHPLSTASLQWLFHHFASAEHAHLSASYQKQQLDSQVQHAFHKDAVVGKPKARMENGVQVLEWEVDEKNTAGNVQQTAWTSEQDDAYRKSRFQRARAVMQSLNIDDETSLYIERSELARIGLNRKIDQMVSVEDQLKQLAANDQPSDEVIRLAALELQIINPNQDDSLLPSGAISCSKTSTKPLLDGNLDDVLWNSARKQSSKLPMQRWNEGHTNATDHILLARDEEFLYLAVDCRNVDSFGYTEQPQQRRRRDETLSNSDRVEIAIDIDRDFETYYSLTVDWKGRVADSLGNNLAWDPTWYVASKQTATGWTAEIAIPLHQLAKIEPSSPEHWAVSATRHVRNQAVASSWNDLDPNFNPQTRLQHLAESPSVHAAARAGVAHQRRAPLNAFRIVRLPASQISEALPASNVGTTEQMP